MNIISGAEKSTTLHILWLRYCAQFVDPFESFEWRMGITTGEKELSIREMNIISGAEKSTALHILWLRYCSVCRSVRIVRMENGIHDPRKRVVDPRNEYH